MLASVAAAATLAPLPTLTLPRHNPFQKTPPTVGANGSGKSNFFHGECEASGLC